MVRICHFLILGAGAPLVKRGSMSGRAQGEGPVCWAKEPACSGLRGACGWQPTTEGAGALLSQNRNRRRSRATEGGLWVKVESAALNFQRQEKGEGPGQRYKNLFASSSTPE